ncbi:unnamed protein product, partial [Rotaria sp. Silwood2]
MLKTFLDIPYLKLIKLLEMDQATKEIFEKFFQVLLDNDLVKVKNDIEQTKEEEAWIVCYPLIPELLKYNTDLHQFVQKAMVLLNIDQNVKSNLHDIFQRIIVELEYLKYRFAAQQRIIDSHEKRINELENDMKLQQARMMAFDIVKLFQYYYIDDILKGSPFSTWKSFTDEWAKRESAVLQNMIANSNTINNNDPTIIDKVQQDPFIRQLVEPVERELSQQWKLNLKLRTIRDIANERHEVAHDPIKTDMDQRCFLVKCNNFTFPAEYQYTTDIKKIINVLNGTKLKRYSQFLFNTSINKDVDDYLYEAKCQLLMYSAIAIIKMNTI